MQYITLTLPCLDPGRQGPEREEHTGWAVAEVKGQGLRTSPSCAKKRVVCEDCIFVCISKLFVRHETAKNLKDPRRRFKRSEMIISYFKNKDHFIWLLFLNNVHICHRRCASRSLSHLNSLNPHPVHTKSTRIRLSLFHCRMR